MSLFGRFWSVTVCFCLCFDQILNFNLKSVRFYFGSIDTHVLTVFQCYNMWMTDVTWKEPRVTWEGANIKGKKPWIRTLGNKADKIHSKILDNEAKWNKNVRYESHSVYHQNSSKHILTVTWRSRYLLILLLLYIRVYVLIFLCFL